MKIEQAVIFCGGYGKRLLPITKKIPKPMVKVENLPFLTHLIMQCKNNGIKEIIILIGYKSNIIKNYFKNGRKLGIKIKYHYSHPKVETFKRLYEARKLIKNNFLLLYSDNYSSLNLKELIDLQKKYNSKLLISICEKKKGNLLLNNKKDKIKSYLKNRLLKSNFVEIGYMIVNKYELIKCYDYKNSEFSSFIQYMSKKKRAYFFLNKTGYLSISDKKRLILTKKYFSNKYILVDRDGVLNLKNKFHYYVRNLNELKINYDLIKKYRSKLLNKKLICISNQAGISTGDLTKQNLNKINSAIQNSYRKLKIKIVEFFVNYSHFNSKDYDRKPNPGLFIKASKKYKFILDRTLYIGDDLRDIEASFKAKTRCLYVGEKKLNAKLKEKYKYTLIKNLP